MFCGGLDGGLFRASSPPADDDRARGCYRSSRRPSRRSSRRFVTVAEACGVRERGCEARRQVLGSGRRMQQPAFLYDGDDDGGGGGGPSGGTTTTATIATHRDTKIGYFGTYIRYLFPSIPRHDIVTTTFQLIPVGSPISLDITLDILSEFSLTYYFRKLTII